MTRGRFAVLIAAMFITASTLAETWERSDGRILTMEETMLGNWLTPRNFRVEWDVSGRTFSYVLGDSTFTISAVSGAVKGHRTESSYAGHPNGNDRKEPGFKVYTVGNNLFIEDSEGSKAITSYPDTGIVCGQSVSRNEFGINGGIFISPDSSRIAFYMKDESRVSKFPLLDITSRTGTHREIRYPMNGMASEKVFLGVYDITTGTTTWMDVDDFTEERYLTNVTWSPDSRNIYIQVLDRSQKNMHLNVYDAATGKYGKTLLTEHDDRYVEPMHPLIFLENDPDKFIYSTNNRDGWWNLYLYSLKDSRLTRLTPSQGDVEYLAQHGNDVFYYSYEVDPTERHMFSVNVKSGKVTRRTFVPGQHSCSFSPDFNYYIDSYSSLKEPLVKEVCSMKGSRHEFYRSADPSDGLLRCDVELGSIRSADGKYDNAYRLVKPAGFDPSHKYPCIVYVYGGPHSQMVNNSFMANLRRWEMYMAQHGYVMFIMDNRGTQYHGAEYEKAIYGQCGQVEMQDQMKGVEWLLSQPWIDSKRIGVHGWSYGGFMTISLMVNYPDVFKVGVAGGPVIDWKWYEVMYGERYMGTEENNPEGFAKTSLIPRAKDLKGSLLICQGAIDNTVVWEHSLSFVEACIKNNVQLDFFPYPTHEHNVSGRDRVHLMQKVTDYFEQRLNSSAVRRESLK